VNILMASLTDSVFLVGETGDNTCSRLQHYVDALRQNEPDSKLDVLILTRRTAWPVTPVEGLQLVPIRVPRAQLFPILGILKALHLRRHLHPDVITTQDPLDAGLLGIMLKWLFKVSLEVQMHFNLFSPYWLAEHRWWNQTRRWLAHFVLARADAIRVVSSPLKEALADTWCIPTNRIAVIPVPVFYDARSRETSSASIDGLSDPNSKVVLFVGHLYHPKNLPGLFEIIEQVLHARPDVEFVLVGEGPENPYAQKRAAALDERRVHLVGSIPYAELPRYYRRAEVLILPSLQEGFGRVVLEGYLFGTPAVATRCGGPEDIIIDGETGFLAEVEDMAGFTDRVLWLLDHPEQARRMGERGRAHVLQKFDPDRLVAQMVAQWQRLSMTAHRVITEVAVPD
jgi:glycosyltransferase involved in cell wall biosynthesis